MRVTVLTERDVSLGLIDTGLFRANERDVQSNVFLGVTNFPIRLAVKAYSGGYVYVTNQLDGTVSAIDPATNAATAAVVWASTQSG